MSLIDLDPASFAAPASRRPGAPDRAPVRVRHSLDATGLLDLPRLAQLASVLPADSIEHNLGAVPDVVPSGAAPQAALSPREIVETIDTNGCWLVLKNIEQDPEYAALLDACLDEIEPAVTASEGRSVIREGFVFLSAPGSVTPTHIDPEHNILLHLRGTKSMEIGRFADDTALARQAERLHSGEHRNLADAAVDLEVFPLVAGDGIYVPVHAPHLVRNGPRPAVSLSVTWGTRATLRAGRVHGLNARLRARGRVVTPPGESAVRDEVKAFAGRALSRLTR